MAFDYAKEISSLSSENRLVYHELLAHNLTVSIRGILYEKNISDPEKLDRIRLVNEIMHRITSKIRILRLNENQWTEEDTWLMLNEYISENENIRGEIYYSINVALSAL